MTDAQKIDPDRAIRDAFLGVEIEIEGRTFRCPALKLKDSMRFLSLLADAEDGKGRAILEILEEFPKAMGADRDPELAEAIEGLMPAEFFDVVRRFFGSRRTPPQVDTGMPAPEATDRVRHPTERPTKE